MTKTYTFDLDIISDLHKDAYGFRPSQSFWAILAAADADQKQAIWDDLLDTLDSTLEREAMEQVRAIERFERLVAELVNCGAKDFEMAIQWLHQSNETDGDDEYLEYRLGLPYGHIAKTRDAVYA